MKATLFSCLFIVSHFASAQTFTEILSALPNGGVEDGSVAMADVNGDTHKDVLITGLNGSSIAIAKLYINDGSGNFTESVGTPFEGVHESSIAFADVNGDTYQDVLITGDKNVDELIAQLYTNDGAGNFSLSISTPFEGVEDGSVAFADVNGDTYQDVLITGNKGLETPIAKLYINNGSGNFTESVGASFDGVEDAAIAFADVNGDMHQDVLITGESSSGIRIAKLYTNGGSGNFILSATAPFEGVEDGSVAFADVNGDTYQDVLITGKNNAGNQIAELYTNNGSGIFSLITGSSLAAVEDGSIAFGDVNADTYQDVIISGENNTGVSIAKLYTNDGSGNFTEVVGTSFEGVQASAIAMADVDGDTHLDVLLTGSNISGIPIAKLYSNDENISSINKLGFGNFSNFRLFPNPAVQGQINIQISSAINAEVGISLLDVNGKILKQEQTRLTPGMNLILLDYASLASGLYMIRMEYKKNISSFKIMLD
ncbi:MAG: FG-GAP-like repeat-containing protein [Bacteroidia bacterium]|nr:FG-GAP-like repeat-containing protein [Bacteroidia bacterium]